MNLMKHTVATIAALLVAATAYAGEERQSVIKTLRGGQEGWAKVRNDGSVVEYVPDWKPNAAEQAERYHSGGSFYGTQPVPRLDVFLVPRKQRIRPIPDGFFEDKRWVKDDFTWVSPAD